jgi:hypothetical protein
MNRLLYIALILTIGTLIATTTPAQIPDTYTNLKVLPKDIKKAQLLQHMKNFSKALGVRCHFCHKGEEGKSLSTYDFASDENYHKDIARLMIGMTHKINGEILKDLKDGQFTQVTCQTCHRGNKEPEG